VVSAEAVGADLRANLACEVDEQESAEGLDTNLSESRTGMSVLEYRRRSPPILMTSVRHPRGGVTRGN